MIKTIFRLIPVALFLLSSGVRSESQSAQKIHLYFHTNAINPETGGHFAIDAGTFPSFQDATESFRYYADGDAKSALPDSHTQNLQLIVVVPKGTAPEHVEQFKNEALTHFAPEPRLGLTLKVETFEVDTEPQIQQLLLADNFLKDVSKDEQNPEARENIAQVRRVTQQEIQGIKQWREGWLRNTKAFFNNPEHLKKSAVTVASIKATVSMVTVVSKYGVNASSIGIGLLMGGISAAFGYHAVHYSDFCQHHKLFLSRQFPWLEKFPPIKYYNDSPNLKSFAINFVRSVGLSYVAKVLAALSGQSFVKNGVTVYAANPNHGWDFLRESFGLGTLELVGDMFADTGSRKLTQKGVITHTQRNYILWSIGLIDTLMHSFFRINMTQAAFITGTVSGILKMTVKLTGDRARVRDRKIMVVSGALADKETGKLPKIVLSQHGFNEALAVHPGVESTLRERPEFFSNDPKAFGSLLNADTLPLSEVATISNRFFRESKSLVESCGKIFARVGK